MQVVARRHRFFWRATYRFHCNGVTAKRRSLARADPAGRSKLERLKDRIRLALTVGNDQHHIPVDWSRVDRLPSKFFREHSFAPLEDCSGDFHVLLDLALVVRQEGRGCVTE